MFSVSHKTILSLFSCLCFTASLFFSYFPSPWKNPIKAVATKKRLTDFPLWLHQPVNKPQRKAESREKERAETYSATGNKDICIANEVRQ